MRAPSRSSVPYDESVMMSDFYEKLCNSKLTPARLRELTGVTKRTFQRWLKADAAPKYVETILICYGYDLGWLDDAWQGCYIGAREGLLYIKDAPRPYSKTDIQVIYHKWQWLHWYYDKWLLSENTETESAPDNVIQYDFPFTG